MLGQAEHSVGALDAGNVQVILGNTHHGAAGEDTLRIFLEALGLVDELLEGHAQRHQQVLGLLDGVTGDGDHTVGDSLPSTTASYTAAAVPTLNTAQPT